MAYFLKSDKFHNDGPLGERDYEDAGSRGLSIANPIQTAIAKREAKVASVSKQRFALIARLTAEFVATNGRRPLRSEVDAINRKANITVGL